MKKKNTFSLFKNTTKLSMTHKMCLGIALIGMFSCNYAIAGIISYDDFSANNGGYTVVNQNLTSGWTWDGTDTWYVNGSQTANDGIGNENTLLTSPDIIVTAAGSVELRFSHRYSIEPDWDGGAVFLSINSGVYNQINGTSFSQNGYTYASLLGNHALVGQPGFNGESPGYPQNAFITSIADLGTFNAGDTLNLRFLMAFDEFVSGTDPNWQIDWVQVSDSSAPVPEPTTMLLLGTGLAGVAGAARRKRKKNQA